MIRNSLPVRLLPGVVAAATLAFGGVAMTKPQGLYSTEKLTDAAVYSSADPDRRIGEVEDVLLDDDMRVRALVIETGGLLQVGAGQYVVDAGRFTLDTRHGDDLETMEYRVTVDMTPEELAQQPRYTDAWWSEARETVRRAWVKTRERATSAWESTREIAADALTRAGEALGDTGNGASSGSEQGGPDDAR